VKPGNSVSAAQDHGSIDIMEAAPWAPAKLTFAQVLLALLALTAIRIVGLHFSVVDLFFDEAQYWACLANCRLATFRSRHCWPG